MSSKKARPVHVTASRISDRLLLALLEEDAPHGDLTSESLPMESIAARATFAARGFMTLSGIEEACRIFELSGAQSEPQQLSGAGVDEGTPLLSAQGSALAILKAWKVAQTLVEAMSGIATATGEMRRVLLEQGLDVPVACTRKAFPGTRAIAARAVRDGAGVMHRLGLSETLLLFPEHRSLLGPDSLVQAIATLRKSQPEKRVVVEVASIAEGLRAAQAGADVLQLERMSPHDLAILKEQLSEAGIGRVKVAPAGGVNAANVLAYARAGADFVVTSAPYFARPADVKVTIVCDSSGLRT